jgi:hypothetical protein
VVEGAQEYCSSTLPSSHTAPIVQYQYQQHGPLAAFLTWLPQTWHSTEYYLCTTVVSLSLEDLITAQTARITEMDDLHSMHFTLVRACECCNPPPSGAQGKVLTVLYRTVRPRSLHQFHYPDVIAQGFVNLSGIDLASNRKLIYIANRATSLPRISDMGILGCWALGTGFTFTRAKHIQSARKDKAKGQRGCKSSREPKPSSPTCIRTG